MIENPELLGLDGDLVTRDSERSQPDVGRLDLLLVDTEADIRYEVEIQLGALDEKHIIHTIEYWDIERRRYPQYEHIAVIVAEEVTGRFHNVISLLNSNVTIPLIAIQIKGVKVKDEFALVTTRVVDLVRLGTDEEDDPGEPVDRSSWVAKSSVNSLQIMDSLIEMIDEIHPSVSSRFNKHYIGIGYEGQPRNFVVFKPSKFHVLTEFKIPRDEELTASLSEIGLDTLPYQQRYGQYRVKLRQEDLKEHCETLADLVSRARDAYYGS